MARPRGYSEDLKAAVLEEIDAGEPVAKVAEKYGVSRAIPYRWLQRREKERAGPPPLGSDHARIHLVIDVDASAVIEHFAPVVEALYRIAAITPCADCDGTGTLPAMMDGPCQHCDGTGVVPVLTARQAATQAALALTALEATHAGD